METLDRAQDWLSGRLDRKIKINTGIVSSDAKEIHDLCFTLSLISIARSLNSLASAAHVAANPGEEVSNDSEDNAE